MATILIERQLRDNCLEPHKDIDAEGGKSYEPHHMTSYHSSPLDRRYHDNDNTIGSKHTKSKQSSNGQQGSGVKVPVIAKESRKQCQRSLATGASADVCRVREQTTSQSMLRHPAERQRHERQSDPHVTMSTTVSSCVENSAPATIRKSVHLRVGGGRCAEGVSENDAVSDRNGDRRTQRKQGPDMMTSSNGLVAAQSNVRQIKRQETKVYKSSTLSAAAHSAFDSSPTTRQQGQTVAGNVNGLSLKADQRNKSQLSVKTSPQKQQLQLQKSKDATRVSAVLKTNSRRQVTAADVNTSLKRHSKRPENGDALKDFDNKANPKQKVVADDDSELEDDVFEQ